MAKGADRYLACEPWRVVERGFHAERNRASESVFSLGNEMMGLRGYPEEGTSAPGMRGIYFGGVYELKEESPHGAYKGVVTRTHYMVCAADFLYTRIDCAGERIMLTERARDHERVLDMRSGLLSRSYAEELPGGGVLSLSFERLLGMDDARLAAQRVRLTCNRPVTLTLDMGVDGAVVHQTTGECLWRMEGSAAGDMRAAMRMRTATTDFTVDYAFALDAPVPGMLIEEDRRLFFRMTLSLKPGEPCVIERRAINAVNAAKPLATDALRDAPGFDVLLAANRRHYDEFWLTADVDIEGDEWNRQGIRYCVFQLHQTYRGLSPMHNIGAKGLTGEAYNGHAFWDSETYCLPYYLLTDKKAAKSLLMFRYNTLDNARARAKQLDLAGACYPIATLNGDEACTLWQHASLQMQPSTAVAYGIWLYARRTGDTAFLYNEGLEMLTEICRYIASRGDWNADHSGYGFYGVMGPDEFHMMVSNNFYTNYMAKKTIEFTLDVLGEAPDGARFADEAETGAWREIADHMILPRRDDGVYEQHEGYFTLPHIDIHTIPITDFPLYDHWSYDRIYRTDMIKQPDVLMAMFLYPADFPREVLRANYAYYEPRCIHESSLSPSVHAILARALDMDDEAFDFFGFATRMDLDDYNRNTRDGLHLTSIAAAWMTIVYGFAGMRTDGDLIALSPTLPKPWTRYAFRFLVGDSVVHARIDKDGCRLSLTRGEPVTVVLNGVRERVEKVDRTKGGDASCEARALSC